MKKFFLAVLIAAGGLAATIAPSSAVTPAHLAASSSPQIEQVGWHGWRKHGWGRHHDNGLHRGWHRGRHEGWRRHDGWHRHGGGHHRW